MKITNIINEKWYITTGPMDTKRIIKEYYQQLYAHKFDNQDEMDQLCKKTQSAKIYKFCKKWTVWIGLYLFKN